MPRTRALLFLIIFTLLLPFFVIRFFAAVAANATTAVNRTHIGVVADTTAGMGPELALFSNAWQNADFSHEAAGGDSLAVTGPVGIASHCDPICPPLTATFHLVGFKDVAQYRGNTPSYNTFGQSLSNLEAGGGGSCPDNALGGLLTMAKNLPMNKILAGDVVLVTDATPFGNRANYAFVTNKMLRRGINVHSLVSGWCAGAPIPEAALQFLTQATGGHYYHPVTPADYLTETLMVQDKLFATDLLLSQEDNAGSGSPDIIPLVVDSSMFGLSVDGTIRNCLTCPMVSLYQPSPELSVSANAAVQLELRDPEGKVIDTTTVGFDELASSSRRLLRLYPPLTATLKTGNWEIRVNGEGIYNITVVAQSNLHFAYLGSGTMPLSRPSFLRVALGETSGEVVWTPLTATFKLVPYDGVGDTQPVDLYDDGQHNDGAAGDGIYGGMVQPSASGWWRLSAEGALSDGSSFRRLAEVPLRVRPYRLTEPESATVAPETTRQITFTLHNEAPAGPGLDPQSTAAAATTFELGLFSEQGWTITDTIPSTVTLAPGETYTVTTSVIIPADAPPGAVEESTFVAVDANDLDTGLTGVALTRVADNSVYLPLVIK